MGKIPAPVPVTSTITSSSVTLRCGWSKWASAFEWPVATSAITSHAYRNNNNNSNASMASISLQWRHVQPGMGGTWEAVSSVSRDDQWREVTVKELHPYTSYRVRTMLRYYPDSYFQGVNKCCCAIKIMHSGQQYT